MKIRTKLRLRAKYRRLLRHRKAIAGWTAAAAAIAAGILLRRRRIESLSAQRG